MADCRDCGASWAGYNTCHCSGCHKTFTGLTAFDKHRQKYKCLDPQSVGLVLSERAYPCWGIPSHLEEKKDDA